MAMAESRNRNISFKQKVVQTVVAIGITAAAIGAVGYGTVRLSSRVDNGYASAVEEVAADMSRKDFTSIKFPISLRVPSSWEWIETKDNREKMDFLKGRVNHAAMSLKIKSNPSPEWATLKDAADHISNEIKTNDKWINVKVLSDQEMESDSKLESLKKLSIDGQKTSFIYVNNAGERDGFLYTMGNRGPLEERVIAVFQDPNSGNIVTLEGAWMSSWAPGDLAAINPFAGSPPRITKRERDVSLEQFKEVFESAQLLISKNPSSTP